MREALQTVALAASMLYVVGWSVLAWLKRAAPYIEDEEGGR